MSLWALNWALVQQCGTPAAKMVLIILSRYANTEGWAWPSRLTLAKATEQSSDSVDRALRLLTERGLVEKGGRQIRQDGGDSTVRYRLLFDPRAVDAHLAGNHTPPKVRNNEHTGEGGEPAFPMAPPVPQIAAGGVAQPAAGTPPQIAAGGAANLRQGGAAICGTSQERKESNRGISPLPPEDVGTRSLFETEEGDQDAAADQAASGSDGFARRDRRPLRPRRREGTSPPLAGEALARYRELERAYPPDGVIAGRQREAQALFAALTPAEQAAAIAKARAYADTCRRREQKVRNLENWLRATDFSAGAIAGGAAPPIDLVEARNAAGLAAIQRGETPTGCSVFVRAESPEGAAWEAYFDRYGHRPVWRELGKGLGAYLPALRPPAAEVA